MIFSLQNMNPLEQKVDYFLKAKGLLNDEETARITVLKGDKVLEVRKFQGSYDFVRTIPAKEEELEIREVSELLVLPLQPLDNPDGSLYLEQRFIQFDSDISFASEARYDVDGYLKLVYAAVYLREDGYGKYIFPPNNSRGYISQQTAEAHPETGCPIKITGVILRGCIELLFSNEEVGEKYFIPRQSLPIDQRLDKLLAEFS